VIGQKTSDRNIPYSAIRDSHAEHRNEMEHIAFQKVETLDENPLLQSLVNLLDFASNQKYIFHPIEYHQKDT
jgi:hypothetical protein